MSKTVQHVLSLDTLHQVDDDFTARFDELLQAMAKDCMRRPGVKRVRKATLEVRLKPKQKDAGSAREVEVELATKSTPPPITSNAGSMSSTVHGAMKFKPKQGMLFD